MDHVDKYNEAMLAAMDLIWGEGFMAPGEKAILTFW